MSQPSSLLRVCALAKSYGDFRAVKEVSFSLDVGEKLAIIGPNGAGKTTCFNMIMGQIAPSAGRIEFENRLISGMPPREIWRLGVGRTFQIATVFASLTVEDNLRVAFDSYSHNTFNFFPWRRSPQEALSIALQQVGLEKARTHAASELAYGDVKRLELAMALLNRPRLLLMDEPTAGMAPSEREALMRLVSSIVQERKMAVLFTEHDMEAVFAHADRVLVLDRGRLIAEGTPDKVRADPNVQSVYLGSGAAFQ